MYFKRFFVVVVLYKHRETLLIRLNLSNNTFFFFNNLLQIQKQLFQIRYKDFKTIYAIHVNNKIKWKNIKDIFFNNVLIKNFLQSPKRK